MRYDKHIKAVVIGMAIIFIGSSITPSITGYDDTSSVLPRWREGGTPYNPQQAMYPYAIKSVNTKDHPSSGLIESPPEYSPSKGVLYYYTSSQWPTVVRDLVVALTDDDEHDEIAYVVVPSTSQQNFAINLFTAGGANMSKVEFIIEPGNALWLRDYGPHFIWQNGTLGIVDSHYYQSRPLDNFIPTLIGDDHFNMITYDMGVYYSGGNFQPGPNRSGFVTSLINIDNPVSQGFNESFLAGLYQQYQGIDTLHIMPQLPSSVDGTGHIDMWMMIIDEDTVIISKFKPGSNPTAIQITDNAVPYMEALGFEVYRTPAWNVGSTHYTYTNAFRVNDRIFTSYYSDGNPSYADEDAEAFANYSAAAGVDVEIIPIDCYDIIPAAGAIHCIVMQVPLYTENEPAVHVIWPKGDELFVSGTTQTILWETTDTNNTEIPQVDLYYSIDDGFTYEFIDTISDTGSYDWIVPDVYSEQAKIKVVATSVDSDVSEAVSANVFQIASANQTMYDFTNGAGIDKFGWGYQTYTWNGNIDGVRMPVSTEIDSLVTGAYTKISYSDAIGGDSDANRYISPNPTNYYESTHIFEFTIDEDPAEIDDMEIIWEGYADYCTQIEMYIWNYVEGQWCNGDGQSGQNRFMDNWAGNRDGFLEKHIRSNFSNYINNDGQITLLLYAERGPGSYVTLNPTFHDYLHIIISDVIPYNPFVNKIITNLSNNWNFVSLPFNQSSNKTDIIVEYADANYTWYGAVTNGYINDYVFGWNRTFQSYNFAYTLEPGYGYWLYAYEPCELWVEKITITPDDYITDLEADWNIVGVPYNRPVNKTDILVNDISWSDAVTAGIINDHVFGWDRSGQSYNFADTFMPGYAYWMYAYQPCTLKKTNV